MQLVCSGKLAGPRKVQHLHDFPAYVLLPALAIFYAASHVFGQESGQESAQGIRRVALSPADSFHELVVEEGFTARVIAHEPQVIDPVEIAFDDRGRMWVVEMRDYPFRTAEQPGGRIRVLSDVNSDGTFESSHLFADHLEMPTGLALWKNGAVVTVAGQMVYLRDDDGDLQSDATEIWLEGFTEDNEQLRANHPRLGPDAAWYIACGLRGGDVRLGGDVARGENQPLKIGSRDVRFDPRRRAIELITGPAQFGLCFDALGNRLFCSNRNPAVQVVFEQRDLNGNALAGLAPAIVDVIPAGEQSRVFPLVDAWTTSHLHSGQFTAACGVFLRARSTERAGHLDSDIFVCEPTGSLVKRQLVTTGAYHLQPLAEDALPESEWLASRDPWFRPVNVTLSPDGEIVVVDMHRAVIEHPQWVPEELKNRPDERWGTESGRIYWVGRDAKLPAVLAELRDSPLASRSDEQLAQLVADANPWIRQTSTRLLLEREASGVAEQLVEQAHRPSLSSVARIDSLRLAANLLQAVPPRTAELINGSDVSLAVVALRIGREDTVWLDAYRALISKLVASESKQLQFEALLCLGANADGAEGDDRVLPHLASVVTDSATAYPLIAMASACRNTPDRLLEAWLVELQETTPHQPTQSHLVPAALRGLTSACLRANVDLSRVVQLARRLLQQPTDIPSQLAGLACLEELARSRQQLALFDDEIWSQISTIVTETTSPPPVRAQAITLLGYSGRASDAELLERMFTDNQIPELSVPLLEAWAKTGSPNCDAFLVDNVAAASPNVRRSILRLLAERDSRLALLASSMQTGRLTPRQIGAAELKQLTSRAKGSSQKVLQQYLTEITNSNRRSVTESYRACLTIASDPMRGVEVFRKQCASCHRIGEIGVQVGPDISDSRTKQPLELLHAILDPNLAIDNNYFRFVVLTHDDRVVEGIIAEETGDAITVLGQDNKRERIRREDIVEIKATGVSLMPEGLETQIDPQAMADLIAYIKSWRYLDGAIPGK